MTWARYELEFDYNFYGIKCMQFFFSPKEIPTYWSAVICRSVRKVF